MKKYEIAEELNIDQKTLTNWAKNRPKLHKIVMEHFDKNKKEINNSVQLNGNNHNIGTININSNTELSHAIHEEIQKLPTKKIEYFYHLIKAETLKD